MAGDRRRFVLTGGFPELLIADKAKPGLDDATRLLQSQRVLRNGAVERAVYKDIPQAFGVSNPMMLERLLYTLAGQMTGVLSPATICQALMGLSQPTFDRYLSYFDHPDQPLAFEIAMSGRHHRQGITQFVTRFPRFHGRCYLVAPDQEPRRPQDSWGDEVGTLPLDLLLLATGAQMERDLANRLIG